MKRFQFSLRRMLVMMVCFSIAFGSARMVFISQEAHPLLPKFLQFAYHPIMLALMLISGAALGAGMGVLLGDTYIGFGLGFFFTLALVVWMVL